MLHTCVQKLRCDGQKLKKIRTKHALNLSPVEREERQRRQCEQVELSNRSLEAVKLTHLTAIPHRPQKERNVHMYILRGH